MVKRLINWTFGLALIPLLWAALREVMLMIPSVVSEGVRTWWVYAAGGVLYLLMERFFSRPMIIYVFGHELTHALSGILSGARIHSFRATSKGGEVKMSKSNHFVSLSPYIIPIYSLLVISIYSLIRIWWNRPLLSYLFQFMLGMSLAFHISMTLAAVHRKQPDLKLMGIFLSGVLIAIGNAVILGMIGVSLFKKTPTLKEYGLRISHETLHVWQISLDFAGEKAKNLYTVSSRAGSTLS